MTALERDHAEHLAALERLKRVPTEAESEALSLERNLNPWGYLQNIALMRYTRVNSDGLCRRQQAALAKTGGRT